MKVLCVLLVCLLAFSMASAEVQKLTAANFDKVLKGSDLALVKFYAPWCGHCKKLAPEFKSAADKLAGKAVLAEVDCDEHKELCGQHGVRGYPTLHIFRKGEKAEDYAGGRTGDDIVKYMIANSGPSVTYVASKAEYDAVPMLDAKALVMTSAKDSKLAALIEKLAPALRTSISFSVATDNAVAPDVAMESIVVYRPNEEGEVLAVGDNVDKDAVEAFLKRGRVPMLAAVGPENIQMYNELSAGNIGWLFLDQTKRDEHLKAAMEVAKKYRDDVIMLWVDSDRYGMVAEQLGVPKGSKFPALVIDKNRKHHVHPLDTPVTAESISSFIEKFLKGEVKPTIKSEAVPAEETVDGMTTIVGSRLRAILEQGKDTIILFYAPWCGHCKSFHPIYDKLAKELEKSDVVIAKMDATTNDMDSEMFEVQGFPTIYFVKGGATSAIAYEGDRSYDDVMQFIKKHSSAPIAAADDAAADL